MFYAEYMSQDVMRGEFVFRYRAAVRHRISDEVV
jgi:hypothetical protein